MKEVITFLMGMNDIAVILRLFLATIFGSLIGWERIVTHHNAGIKTFALVSLGSASAAALNLYLAYLPDVGADVSRIPASIVSGIGFLGAGTILITGRKQIKGLSTAASLWACACMGMSIGAGYLTGGIACFLLVIFANMVLMRLSRRVEGNSKYVSLYLELEKSRGVTKLMKVISEQGYSISSMTKSKEKTLLSTDCALLIDLNLNQRMAHAKLLELFSNLDYVNYVEEV